MDRQVSHDSLKKLHGHPKMKIRFKKSLAQKRITSWGLGKKTHCEDKFICIWKSRCEKRGFAKLDTICEVQAISGVGVWDESSEGIELV